MMQRSATTQRRPPGCHFNILRDSGACTRCAQARHCAPRRAGAQAVRHYPQRTREAVFYTRAFRCMLLVVTDGRQASWRMTPLAWARRRRNDTRRVRTWALATRGNERMMQRSATTQRRPPDCHFNIPRDSGACTRCAQARHCAPHRAGAQAVRRYPQRTREADFCTRGCGASAQAVRRQYADSTDSTPTVQTVRRQYTGSTQAVRRQYAASTQTVRSQYRQYVDSTQAVQTVRALHGVFAQAHEHYKHPSRRTKTTTH